MAIRPNVSRWTRTWHPVVDSPVTGTVTVLGAATATLRGSGVIVPYWALVVLTVDLPAVWPLLWWSRRRRVRRLGLCRQCSYDLRESTGDCPERGTPIAETGARQVVAAPERQNGSR